MISPGEAKIRKTVGLAIGIITLIYVSCGHGVRVPHEHSLSISARRTVLSWKWFPTPALPHLQFVSTLMADNVRVVVRPQISSAFATPPAGPV